MLDKVLIILLEIGFGVKFDFVGSISLTEILLIAFLPLYFRKDIIIDTPILKRITTLYIILLFSQILSEVVIGTSTQNMMRGFATTVISYLHMYVLVRFFSKSRSLVVYALIGMTINALLFGTEVDGEVSEALTGEGAAFLKFYVAPIIINVLILISVFYAKFRMAVMCMLIGILLIVLGARSAGLLLLLTGLITNSFSVFRAEIIRKRIVISLMIFTVIGYAGYVFYIGKVMSGEISAGNTQQLQEASNPYNPVNLFLLARTETFVGWNAFMDNFWFGHGGGALDVTGKYRELLFFFRDEQYRVTDKEIIPSHSVLVGTGMQFGIFSFLFMLYLGFLFLRIGFNSIHARDRYVIIVVYFLLSIVWNMMFSPFAHFRFTIPLYFAFLVATYLIHIRAKTVIQL